jgi:hypothetical protein
VDEVSRCAGFSKNRLKTVSRTIFKEQKIIILNSYKGLILSCNQNIIYYPVEASEALDSGLILFQ